MLAISDQIGIDIDSQQVLQHIGYSTAREPPARTVSLVDEYLEYSNHLVDAVYSYAIRDIYLVQGPLVVIENAGVFESTVVARLLEQCHQVAVFALTIGEYLEEMIYQLTGKGLVLQATVMDAIGSITTEKVADFVQDRISEVASAQGLAISRRFSPGYCDWDLSQQEMIFKLMRGDMAGVRLTEEYLMIPHKSISGIIGIGIENNNIETYNPCKTCPTSDCPGRRI